MPVWIRSPVGVRHRHGTGFSPAALRFPRTASSLIRPHRIRATTPRRQAARLKFSRACIAVMVFNLVTAAGWEALQESGLFARCRSAGANEYLAHGAPGVTSAYGAIGSVDPRSWRR